MEIGGRALIAIVDQQADHGILEFSILFDLVAKRMGWRHSRTRASRAASAEPSSWSKSMPGLLSHQPALQAVGEPGDDSRRGLSSVDRDTLGAVPLIVVAKLVCRDHLDQVVKGR